MRQAHSLPEAYGSYEARCDALLLGRLGAELALVYRETLQAPLPAALQAIVDQLEKPRESPGRDGTAPGP